MLRNYQFLYLKSIKMATIKNKQTNTHTKPPKVTSIGKDAEELEPLCAVDEIKMVRLLWKIVWQFLKN